MIDKYKNAGLDYELIISKFPDNNDYEKIVKTYLEDPFFEQLKDYLDDEDYALAKDATKGLFILAQELYLYPLYIALMEIYEDIEEEIYNDLINKYNQMYEIYKKIQGVFVC